MNWGLLHCRWTLYQLSYQGSPNQLYFNKKIAYVHKESGFKDCPSLPTLDLHRHLEDVNSKEVKIEILQALLEGTYIWTQEVLLKWPSTSSPSTLVYKVGTLFPANSEGMEKHIRLGVQELWLLVLPGPRADYVCLGKSVTTLGCPSPVWNITAWGCLVGISGIAL